MATMSEIEHWNHLKFIIRYISLANMILNLPFTSLRAFEAVVRLSGFSAAANELGVTQSAVSQHVRSLESWLGQELLIRGARKSSPTEDGQRLAQAIAQGLGQISDVCGDLRGKTRHKHTIVINCPPGFAYIWLFPRLVRFDLAHPDLTISIATDAGHSGFASREADIAIRYELGDVPGFHGRKLMQESLFPVCAPSLLKGPRPIRQVADLAHHTILFDDVERYGEDSPNWDFWARECGMHLPTPIRTRRFGQSNMGVQAAIDGMGVGLGRSPLVNDALADGRLVRPFAPVAKSRLGYWVAYRAGAERFDKIARFLSWIEEEARAQPSYADWVAQGGQTA